MNKMKAPTKLWNRNFLLLWQGQLVSALGSHAYMIAFGFYVLDLTGSTTIMGSYLAASTLPAVLLSPFSGVLVDRWNRKSVLIWADFIRGVGILFLGLGALFGFAELWHFFVIGVITGACGSFFEPAIMSIVPDIVPEEKLTNANGATNMIQSLGGIFGNSLGGTLYVFLGAPLLFIADGISYLFSGISEMFISVPDVERNNREFKFFDDMKDGLLFIIKKKGVLYIYIFVFIINFSGYMVFVLLLPLFERRADLGPVQYGFVMAAFAIGALSGHLLNTIYTLPARFRFNILILSLMLDCIVLIAFVFVGSIELMVVFITISGFNNATINTLIMASVQRIVPQDLRGKVFGLLATMSGGLAPIAMATAGILADIYQIKWIVVANFSLIFLFAVILSFNIPVKKLLNNEN